jgi:hypothetical protein
MNERVTRTILLLMRRYGEIVAYRWSLELIAGYLIKVLLRRLRVLQK